MRSEYQVYYTLLSVGDALAADVRVVVCFFVV